MCPIWWHQGRPPQLTEVSGHGKAKAKGEGDRLSMIMKDHRKSLQWGQHMSSVPMYLPKGNPMPLTQKAVGIILALLDLIKGAFFHIG